MGLSLKTLEASASPKHGRKFDKCKLKLPSLASLKGPAFVSSMHSSWFTPIELHGVGPGFLKGHLLPERKVIFRGPGLTAPAFAAEVASNQDFSGVAPKLWNTLQKRFPGAKADRLGVRQAFFFGRMLLDVLLSL